MGEHLCTELELVVDDVAFDEEAAVRKVAVLRLRHDGFARTSVESPRADVFLKPERDFIPDLSDAKPLGITARGELEHSEGTDLRHMPGFFYPRPFYAGFNVCNPEGTWACAARKVIRVV